jgi:anti-sigma-K factor RskA
LNIQEYISSGIVESYVLGLADEAERAEFEQMCALHPEVRAAREAFEIQLEQHVMADAAVPSQHVRETILYQVFSEQPVQTNGHSNRGAQPAKVFALPAAMRYVAAAVIILLAGSAVLNVYYFNKYREFSRRYDRLLAQQTELVKSNNAMQTKLNSYQNTIAGLTDTGMSVIKMMGKAAPSSPAPGSMAMVYWDTRSKDVYLMANNLPMPAPGKQYQLWAIVDNKPVDAGMVDMDKAHVMVKMKNIPRAQLFAITLEQAGGSPTPQGPMYVMGKV